MIINFQNCCAGKYFDFVTCKVACVLNAQHWGFDGTFYNSDGLTEGDGFPHWHCGVLAGDYTKKWWGTIRTTWTFNDGTVQVDLVKFYPYFYNAADTTAIALGIPGAPANSLNPVDDLTLTGFPGGPDSITFPSVITYGSGGAGPPLDHSMQEDNQGPGGGPTPPVVIATPSTMSTTITCWGADAAYVSGNRKVVTVLVNLEDPMTAEAAWAAVGGGLQATGSVVVGCREKPVLFDFYGTSSTYFPLNVIPAGSVYDKYGIYTLNPLTAKMLYGITLGANESIGTGWPSVFPDFTGTYGPTAALTIGTYFPYHWPDGASYNYLLTSPVSTTVIDAGVFPTLKYSTCFCSLTGIGVRIGGGQPPTGTAAWASGTAYTLGQLVVDSSVACRMQKVTTAGTSGGSTPGWTGTTTTDGGVTWTAVLVPVTAIVSGTHVRSLTIFPLRGGNIITAETDTQRNVASDNPAGIRDFSGQFNSGLIRESSRLLVPANPAALIAAWVDPFHFTDIGSGPTLQLINYQIQTIVSGGGGIIDDDVAGALLTAGQRTVNYSDIGSATGFGYIYMGALTDVRLPDVPSGTSGAGSGVGGFDGQL